MNFESIQNQAQTINNSIPDFKLVKNSRRKPPRGPGPTGDSEMDML